MRIAILGAGGTGACAALELADRGYNVDLYDENSQPVSRASLNNEGKIHLGLVYAKDRTLNTAKTMILGAVHFQAYLHRWIGADVHRMTTSTPYHYAVHRETMTSVDELALHYDRCRALLEDACASTGMSYLGEERTLLAERLPAHLWQGLVSGGRFLSVFRTSERAVDPRIVGEFLRAAVHANPRIRFIGGARVSNVAWTESGGLRVGFRLGDDFAETYDQVANTLWHGRLGVDATLGVVPERGWIHRYKVGGWLNKSVASEAVPSMTMVLGPFGDIVNHGDNGLYFSWYPVGVVASSRELEPPQWDLSLSSARLKATARQSYEELRKQCPGLPSISRDEDAPIPCGGVIFAWGATDIDDEDSELHTRHAIGIHSVRNYHSVNTGKYTMIPYLGFKTAERILGIA